MAMMYVRFLDASKAFQSVNHLELVMAVVYAYFLDGIKTFHSVNHWELSKVVVVVVVIDDSGHIIHLVWWLILT